MKVAHLILTYTNPALTERLIKRLSIPEFDFYIHVDKKFSVDPYLYLQNYPNVFLIQNREEVKWAAYSTIKATFNCIKEIALKGVNYNYINFISGQDYPIKSADYLLEFYKKNQGKEFIEYQSLEEQWIEALPRITNYHFTNSSFKGRYRLQSIVNFFAPKRKLPEGLKPYGKSMFWMLSLNCAKFVVDYMESKPQLERFFFYTWGSDEFVFQTILMNSDYKDKLINNDYRYIDWTAGGAHPKTFDVSDFEAIKESDDLFARKFSTEADSELLDRIDQLLT